MTPERWLKVRDVLHQAMQLEPGERSSYLEHSCTGDAALREQVNDLLLAEQDLMTDFLESLPQAEAALDRLKILTSSQNEFRTKNEPLIGRRVGSYLIVEEIGSGGMGEVYRAFRADDQYRKQVAVKVVRQGRNSEAVIERFKNERQILADLDHPHIARLLDGGTTDAGDPFFVMELIEGLPVDEYCDRHRLGITERLELFCRVGSAVEYAHRHLIVHRDIKPSNILVTSDGLPKLLDFGIAKILGATTVGDKPETPMTTFPALTPAYASPEQVTGTTITTASDIYSLGVVLYELLAGRSPYQLSDHTTAEMVRAVCEIEPEKLSVAVLRNEPVQAQRRSSASDGAGIAAARQSSPEKLSKRLVGDLDTILLMALRKEPQRRYASVEQFAQDVRRNLTSLPVIARTDTLAYRTTKFVNRHKAGVGATAAVFLTLIVGMAVTLREAQIARSQETRAERHFNAVRALTNSLIFDIHDNIQELPGATKARKVLLDRALQYLDQLSQEAVRDAGLQRELASGYERLGDVQGKPLIASLGDNVGALQSYSRSLILRQRLVDSREANSDDLIRLAKIHRLIASTALQTGDVSGAFAHAKRAVTVAMSVSSSDTKNDQAASELVWDYLALGNIETGLFGGMGLGDSSTALLDFEKGLEISSKLLRNDPENLSLEQQNVILYERIGGLQGLMGRTSEGLQNLNVAMNTLRSRAASTDDVVFQRGVGAVASVIGGVLITNGQFAPALASFREELTVFEGLSKRDPHDRQGRADLTSAYSDVGGALMRLGKFREALVNTRRAIAIDRELIALDPKTNVYRSLLALHRVMEAEVLSRTGDVAGALQGFAEARRVYDQLAQSDERNLEARLNVGTADTKVAATLLRLGHYDEAQKSFRRAIQASEQPAKGKAPNLEAQYTLANAYSGLGDIAFHLAGRANKILACKEASPWYEESIHVWNAIPNRGVISPAGFDVGDPAQVAHYLAMCKATLGKIEDSPARKPKSEVSHRRAKAVAAATR